MTIKTEVTKRLKAALETERQRTEREFQERAAGIRAEAEKAERDAIATACAEAEADKLRKDAEDATRIECLMGGMGSFDDIGTVEDRRHWLNTLGVSTGAVARAASCGQGEQNIYAENMTLVRPGEPPVYPNERLLLAMSAVRRMYLAHCSAEEAAKEQERAAARKELLDRLADEQMDEWLARRESERQMEGN